MIESAYLTYYPKNWDVILNRTKDYYGNYKERLRQQTREKYRNLSENKKIKKEKMEKIDISICLKKRNKRPQEYQKNYHEVKKPQYNNK